jgi:hypothetical protein
LVWNTEVMPDILSDPKLAINPVRDVDRIRRIRYARRRVDRRRFSRLSLAA